NVLTEFLDDLHQEPWGLPEINFLVAKRPDLLYQNCDARGAREASLLDVPKENWGTRPAVVLDVCDRLTYQAVVDRLSVDLIGHMSPDAYRWRLPPNNPIAGTYSHNNHQWDGYRGHLGLLAGLYDVALRSDLVSCFARMPI